MKTFKEHINSKLNEGPAEDNSLDLAVLNIENVEILYQKAMRAKTSGELKKVMLSMKNKFPDAEKIQFKKISWDDVYKDINESTDIKKTIDYLNRDIDKAIKNKDAKYLNILSKELGTILKDLEK